jgi:hypothetical protein
MLEQSLKISQGSISVLPVPVIKNEGVSHILVQNKEAIPAP